MVMVDLCGLVIGGWLIVFFGLVMEVALVGSLSVCVLVIGVSWIGLLHISGLTSGCLQCN